MRTALDIQRARRNPTVWDLMDQINDFVDRAFSVGMPAMSVPTMSNLPSPDFFLSPGVLAPDVDVEESDNAYLLSVDLPGITQEDVTINLSEGSILTISGERRREDRKSATEGVSHYERYYGRFQRSFSLPDTADANKIQANFENGVLQILIPKSEEAKPKPIKVESGKGESFAKLLGRKDVKESASVKAETAH